MSRNKGPDCLTANYTDKFFEPEFGTLILQVTLHPRDVVQVAWFGGKTDMDLPRNSSLWLGLDGELLEIIDSGLFVDNSNWTYIDSCGNTKQSYNWTVPELDQLNGYFNFTLDTTFNFEVLSQRYSGQGARFRSPEFYIEEAMSTSSAMSSSTTPVSSSSSKTDLASPISTDQNPSQTTSPFPITTKSSHLTGGAKAGIGTGCAVFVLVVAIFSVLITRRRQKSIASPPATESNGYSKAELSGEGAQNRASEVAGAAIHEKDSQTREQSPVELAAD